eukprot:COSAG02_NODE_68664_length_231_cov_2.537879_1_plen_33_part_10
MIRSVDPAAAARRSSVRGSRVYTYTAHAGGATL